MPLPSPSACVPQAMALAPAAWAATKLILLHGPVIFFAVAAARLFRRGRLPAAVAAMLIYFLALSLPLWLTPISYLWLQAWSVAYGVAGVAIWIWESRRRGARGENPRHSKLAVDTITIGGVLTVALLAAALLVTAIIAPRFDHDPLTYQLYFAATWLRDGRLSIVPTPFGDPSQAYGPALASLYYLWLMAPLGTDMMAQAGQWPFLVLTVLAAVGIAREIGSAKGRAFLAGLFIFMSPLAVYEGRGALSDLAVAAFFASSLFFLLRALRERRPAGLALALASAGLMAGCKFTALPLLILLLPLLALAGGRLRGKGAWAAWLAGAAAGLAGGGLWYARNWVVAGNPFFPIRVSVLGREIFPGLYGRERMMHWVFHHSGWKAWWDVAHAIAPPLILVMAVAALIFLAATTSRAGAGAREGDAGPGPDRARAAALFYMALVPFLIDRTFWNVMPYQVDRFWLPALPVMAAALALFFSRFPVATLPGLALAYAGLFLFPLPELRRLKIYLWIEPVLPAAVAVAFGAAWLYHRLSGAAPNQGPGPTPAGSARRIALALAAAFIFCLTAVGLRSYEFRRTAALSDLKYGSGWLALPCPANGATIAYTGSNMPYPLLGPRLQNSVEYVSPSGRVMPPDHVIFREMHSHVPDFLTPEPMISRLELAPRKWADALVSSQADYLFVMHLGANALFNTAHDQQGWPLEDSWARAASRTFLPVYQDESVRIYRLDRSQPPDLPATTELRPPDGMTACAYGANPGCQKFFPLVPLALKSMQTPQ